MIESYTDKKGQLNTFLNTFPSTLANDYLLLNSKANLDLYFTTI